MFMQLTIYTSNDIIYQKKKKKTQLLVSFEFNTKRKSSFY
jgi:hypothetical protein